MEAKTETRPEDLIRLDRTRTRSGPGPGTTGSVRIPDYSTVHGDRRPDDPHYRVSYFQDGLPFDNEGKLVPDDGKTESWEVKGSDGKPIVYSPLYDKAMRERLAKKIKRVMKGFKSAPPSDSDLAEDIDEREEEADEVNLPFWLDGQSDYQPFMVFAALKKRYGVSVHSVAEAVRFLILEKTVMPKELVRPELRRHLQRAA